MTLIYTQTAPTAFSSVGWKYYLVFIITPWLGVFLMGKYFPETAGLSLEDIGVLFGDETASHTNHTPDGKTEKSDVEESSVGAVKQVGDVEGKQVHLL